MTFRTTMTLGLILMLSGCGMISQDNFNPLNWFRGEEEESFVSPTVTAEQEVDPDGRVLVASITDLTVEPRPDGILILATGLPPDQGWFDPVLVATTLDAVPVDGVLSFTFEAQEPFELTRIGNPASREIRAARFFSEAELEGVREIRVIGADNARVARR